jgi:hypothetical protein
MRYLTAYIDQKNVWNRYTNRSILDATNLTPRQMQDLYESLRCDLSPENLCCDGELRGVALKRKSAMLNGALRELLREADLRNVYINEHIWA